MSLLHHHYCCPTVLLQVSVPVRGPPLTEEVQVATEQPEPSSETAIEVASRLRDTVKSGEYRAQYNRLMSVQPSVPPDQARWVQYQCFSMATVH